jgi:hypothetical protein
MFGACSRCHAYWNDRTQFLSDDQIHIEGLKADLTGNDQSAFVFRHTRPDCGAELDVPVMLFDDLRQQARAFDLMAGSANCPGYCKEPPNLKVCSVTCRNASDRLLGVMIRRMLGAA